MPMARGRDDSGLFSTKTMAARWGLFQVPRDCAGTPTAKSFHSHTRAGLNSVSPRKRLFMWAAFPLGEELTDERIVSRPRWIAAPFSIRVPRCHRGRFIFHDGKLRALQTRAAAWSGGHLAHWNLPQWG